MSPNDSSDNRDRDLAIIIGSILGALSAGLAILLGLLLIQRRRYAKNTRRDVTMKHCRREVSTVQRQAGSERHAYRDEGEHCDDMITRPLSVFKSSLRGIVKPMSGKKATHYREKPEENDGLTNTGRPRSDCETDSVGGCNEGFDIRPAPIRRSGAARATFSSNPHHMVLASNKRMGSIFPDDLVIPHQDPLAAHPTEAADVAVMNLVGAEGIGSQQNNVNEGGTKARWGLTGQRSLDKQRAGQNDVLLGSGSSDLRNESSDCALWRDVELQYDRQHVEDHSGVVKQSNKGADQFGEASQTSQPPQTIKRLETSLSRANTASTWRSQPPRLNIPSPLLLNSIGLGGGENDIAADISPETEPWPLVHDRDQLHCAISPITPDRNIPRRYSRILDQGYLECSPNGNDKTQQQSTINTIQRLQISELRQAPTTTTTTHNLQSLPTPKPIKRKPVPSQSKPPVRPPSPPSETTKPSRSESQSRSRVIERGRWWDVNASKDYKKIRDECADDCNVDNVDDNGIDGGDFYLESSSPDS